MTMVSSTYFFHLHNKLSNVGTIVVSSSTMKGTANIGSNGDPVATLPVCW